MTTRYFQAAGIAVFLAALTPLAVPVWAQDKADAEAKPSVTAPAGRHQAPLQTAITAANLTDAQKTSLKPITKKYREERKALIPAPAAGADTPAITPELRTKLAASEDAEAAEVKALLTPDQQTTFQTAYDAAKAARGAGSDPLAHVIDVLKLTDDQKPKILPILTDAAAQIKAVRADTTLERRAQGQKSRAIWDDAKAKIRPLLTADQQATLDTLRGMGGRRAAGAAPGTGG